MKVRTALQQLMCVAVGSFVFWATAQASVVVVIDSGLDVEHQALQDVIWRNPVDFDDNGIDEDGNGLTDDVHGWNFIGNNNRLVEREHGKLYGPEIKRFFEIQAAILQGTALDEDKAWLKEKAQDQDFVRQVMTYGNYSHGTHVSGIVAGDRIDTEVAAIKLIPTKNPLFGLKDDIQQAVREGRSLNWIVKQIIKGGLILVAKAQSTIFGMVGDYVDDIGADVANASLGVGATQARMLLTPILKLANGGKEPMAEDVDELVRFFLQQVLREQEILLKKAPDTLFVFAAGNDGASNDEFPVAPASIRHPHVLSVAATFHTQALAPFSNYGMNVDIAAPGVAIESTVPDNRFLALSGTSQAAPAVAGVAAEVVDRNPHLLPAAVKKLLMETVDKKPWLEGKVRSSGILNRDRAVHAAKLSVTMPLHEAVAAARAEIDDQPDSHIPLERSFDDQFYFDWRYPAIF